DSPSSAGTPSWIGSAIKPRSFGTTLPTSSVTSNGSSAPASMTTVATSKGKNDGTVSVPAAQTARSDRSAIVDNSTAATAPAAAPAVFANTSDADVVLSTVS